MIPTGVRNGGYILLEITLGAAAAPWSNPANLNSPPIIATRITYCLADN
jgi:hypothetical protein